MDDGYKHVPVLASETVEALNIRPDGLYVDCTLGGGGHSELIAERLTTGHVIAIDRDPYAIRKAGERLAAYKDKFTFVNDNYINIKQIMRSLGKDGADGIMMDLGVSSFQLDIPERGFSYTLEAPLDMRMSGEGKSAYDVVNTYSEKELCRILYEYGEERFAPRIAATIAAAREKAPVKTTLELAALIKEAIPMKAREGGHHPAKKSFQAIRIEVNGELDCLGNAVCDAVDMLKKGGRIAVITFHSLEDRAVKKAFAEKASGCECPPEFPVCVCGKKPQIELLTRKPVTASETELGENPRSRSAKLRTAEKL